MMTTIKIQGLSEAEKDAKAILEHVEAIKAILQRASWNGIRVEADLKEQAASDN